MQLRFTIRGLLLLVAFVAVGLGWWVSGRNRPAAPPRYQLQVNGSQATIVNSP
jgi:hypothetical protein